MPWKPCLETVLQFLAQCTVTSSFNLTALVIRQASFNLEHHKYTVLLEMSEIINKIVKNNKHAKCTDNHIDYNYIVKNKELSNAV